MPLIRQGISPLSPLKFALRDVEAQAKQILEQAQHEANRIIGEARAAATPSATPADSSAKSVETPVMAPVTEMQEAIDALRSAAEMIPATIEQLAADLESDVADLALAIAERVTKRAGLIDPNVLAENLREAMKLVVRTGELRIAIHPSQIETINALMPSLKSEWLMLAGAQIIPDETVTPGGCRIATTHGQIDADLQSQLDRIAAELLP